MELPHKNCDTIAEAVPGTSEQRLQKFLTNTPWDEEDLNHQRVEKMVAEATIGNRHPKWGHPHVSFSLGRTGVAGSF